jgi:hypothetical protein
MKPGEEQTVELLGADKLQAAINQAAMPKLEIPTLVPPHKEGEKPAQNGKKQARSPLNGAPVPAGRPAGVRNKLTNLRDAVLEAFDTVGGAAYLVRLAEGTQSDRAAFTSLVAKVLPTQINQNVEGGIKLELSWLGGRSIGTTTAQIPEARTQVLDLEQDSDGGYRIKDPAQSPGGVAEGVPPAGGDSTAAPGHAQSGPGDAQGRET